MPMPQLRARPVLDTERDTMMRGYASHKAFPLGAEGGDQQ